jgi:hypothetical protein
MSGSWIAWQTELWRTWVEPGRSLKIARMAAVGDNPAIRLGTKR